MRGDLLFGGVLALLNGFYDTLPLLSAALLHEIGHLLACRLLGVPIRFIRPTGVGAVIGYDPSTLSYGQEIWIAAAGPALNLAGFFFCFPGECTGGRALFGLSCLALAVFNLLPIRRLDGGVILRDSLTITLGPVRGEKIEKSISFMCTLLLWMCAAAVQIRCGGNLSILLLSVYLLTKITES